MAEERPTTTMPSAAMPIADLMTTPSGMLTVAAGLLLAGWAVFDVLAASSSFPTTSVVAAVFVIYAKYRGSGWGAQLGSPFVLSVLAAIIFITALVWLVEDVRAARVYDALWLIGSATHYVAGAIAGLAWRGLAR